MTELRRRGASPASFFEAYDRSEWLTSPLESQFSYRQCDGSRMAGGNATCDTSAKQICIVQHFRRTSTACWMDLNPHRFKPCGWRHRAVLKCTWLSH